MECIQVGKEEGGVDWLAASEWTDNIKVHFRTIQVKYTWEALSP